MSQDSGVIVKWVVRLTLIVVGVASITYGPLIFLYGHMFIQGIQEICSREQFDKVAWQDSRGVADHARIRMVDDLLKRKNFLGMTREEVTAIVGESDQTGYFSDWDLVYWLGPERSWMSVDSEWLVFRLNEENRVTDYRIVRD